MVNTDRWGEVEERQRRSTRIRERFGLKDPQGSDASDWLLGAGTIPFAVAAVALVVYAVISIVAGVR